MRTTLDLPESLLSEAMEVAHAKTKTKTIILALQELIRKRNIAKLKTYKHCCPVKELAVRKQA